MQLFTMFKVLFYKQGWQQTAKLRKWRTHKHKYQGDETKNDKLPHLKIKIIGWKVWALLVCTIQSRFNKGTQSFSGNEVSCKFFYWYKAVFWLYNGVFTIYKRYRQKNIYAPPKKRRLVPIVIKQIIYM